MTRLRRWWPLLVPAYIVANYVVAPLVIPALSALVFDDLLPRVLERIGG